MSFRPRHLHVMPLHQSGSQEDSLKRVAPRMRWLVWPNSSRGITPLPARSIMKSIVAKWLASRVAFFIDRTESLPSLIPFFFWFVMVFPDLDFLWPIHLCPRRSRLFWVPDCSCWFFCHRFLRFRGRQTCLSYLSVDSAPYPRLPMQSLWSMMDGYTLDDLIFRRDCSLTEDEVVAYVRRSDPKKGWRHHGTSPFLALQNI